MTLLHLVGAHLRKHLTRTVLTLLSIAVAFLLFSYLAAIHRAFNLGVEVAGANRLVVSNAAIVRLLPLDYEKRIESIEGVAQATPITWFHGFPRERGTRFSQFATRPEEFREVYPDLVISDAALARWLETRTGAILGQDTASRYGLETGDQISLVSSIWRTHDGRPWQFEIVGIYEGEKRGTDETVMFFRQDYFDSNRLNNPHEVGLLIVSVFDSVDPLLVSELIDDEFRNSDNETRTAPEAAFLGTIAAQVGDVGTIATGIMCVVFFTILLMASNTMMQSVRERKREFGILKALGFSNGFVIRIVLIESVMLAAAGGLIGLTIGIVTIGRGDPTGGLLPSFYLSPAASLVGLMLALGLGFFSGLIPALQAGRLSPLDALRT